MARDINKELDRVMRVKARMEESSERKVRIVAMSANGKSNTEIAATVGVSPQYVSQVLRKHK